MKRDQVRTDFVSCQICFKPDTAKKHHQCRSPTEMAANSGRLPRPCGTHGRSSTLQWPPTLNDGARPNLEVKHNCRHIVRIHRRQVLNMMEVLHQGACQAIQEASSRDGFHPGSHDLGWRVL